MKVPKLSDAILLGATITDSRPYHLNHCALGMAANAVGIKKCADASYPSRFELILNYWPWLFNTTYWNHIAGAFNEQVCRGKMTLEQLVDWVRAAEPACDCHRFNCDCAARPASEELVEMSTATG